MPIIEKLWAYVATEEDGGEGVCAFYNEKSDMWMPMIGADEERMLSLKSVAKKIADNTNTPVTLVEFSVRKDLEVVKDKQKTVQN